MALCVIVDTTDNLKATNTSNEECQSYILVDSNEYNLMRVDYSITPLEIAEAFTWGFGTYVFFWFLGYCISTARLVIKRV
jgi:molybdopterin/thiamine biosynthesis adenylyltransferase